MRRTLTTIAGLAVAALALAPGVAGAGAPGDLDPSFDGDGRIVLPFIGSPVETLRQPDGRIVIAGTVDEDFAVWRLNPDGSPDRSFGGGDGAAVADFDGSDWASSAALQPDGKILVAGPTGYGPGIARFRPDGSLDPTFDPGGAEGDGRKVLDTSAAALSADAVTALPDGTIAVIGSHWSVKSPADFTITRLTSTGAVHEKATELADFGGEDWAVTGGPAPGGGVVVVGTTNLAGDAERVIAVARYDGEGALVDSFSDDGKTTLGPGDPTDVLTAPDGRVLVVSKLANGDPRVTRLTREGDLDATFGDGGTAAGGFDGEKLAWQIAAALRPDGRMFVAGTAAGATEFAVARLGATGVLDATFGSGGLATVPFSSVSVASAAVVQPDGKLVVAGATLQGLAARLTVVRLLGDPTSAPTGGPGPGPATPTSVPRCAGRRATIVGTAGRDTLRGTARADVIVALGGRDRVLARAGNDLVCAGAGNDRVLGAGGRDRLVGEGGRDRLVGDGGRDRLLGGAGRDRLTGGAGQDRCVGAGGRDSASGCEQQRSL